MQVLTTAIQPAAPVTQRRLRTMLLAWAFTGFNSLRIVAYLPTLLSIQNSGQSDQHSLLTWLTFLGANATMALWLVEQNAHRLNRAAFINAVNALMCTAICVLIVQTRWF